MDIRKVGMKSAAGVSIGSLLFLGALGCSSPATTDATGATGTSPVVPGGTPATATGTAAPGATAAAGTGAAPAGAQQTATGTRPATGAAGAANVGDVMNPGVPAGGPGTPATTAAAGAPATGAAGGGAPATTTPGGGSEDWPLMGYDPGSSFFNKAETVLSKDSAAKLDVLWTADLGGNITGGALQVGGKVYASGPGALYAFDATSGMQLWKTTAASSSTPGFANDTVYLHSTSGKLMAFNAADGKQKWSMSPDPEGTDGSSSATPVGGLVFFGGSNGGAELTGGGGYRGFMAAMDAASGAKKWVQFTVPAGSLGASFWSSPAVSMEDGLVIGGSGNNYGPPATDTSDSLIAFDMNTGDIKWKFQVRSMDTFPSNPAAPDSDLGNNPVMYEAMIGGQLTKMVGGATKYGNVVGVKRLTGEMVWKRDLCAMGAADGANGLFTNFSYSGKSLVAACNTNPSATLYGLNPETGDILWMRALKRAVWGRMAHANGVGVVGTGESVEIFDEDTGAVIKSFPTKGGTVGSTISISHGRIAFGEGFSWSSGNSPGSTLTVLGVK